MKLIPGQHADEQPRRFSDLRKTNLTVTTDTAQVTADGVDDRDCAAVVGKLAEFREIEESQGSKQNPRKTSWFDGVKSFVDSLKS